MSETNFLILLVAGTLIQFLVYCIYVRNLNSLLKAIRPANRHIAPGQVWPLLVWIVNLLLQVLSSEEFGHVYLLNSDAEERAYSIANGIIYLYLVVWHFRIVSGVAISIEREYKSRNLPVGYRPTYYLGVLMIVLSLANFGNFFNLDPFVYNILQVGSLANMVVWIIYWVVTHRYKKKIQAMPEYPEQDESPVFSNLY